MIDIELPKISIVVPVYNVEDYLQECLDSLLNQTYPQIEIVCVNDDSTDASGKILSDYAGKDERIVVVEQESRGVAGTRNNGLDNATGDIVMFVDSDDRLMPIACETVAAAFLLYPGTDDVIFGANCFDGEFTLALHDVLDVHNAVYDEFDSRVLFEEPSLPFIWKTAYSLDFLNSHRIRFDEDLELGEDLVFQFTALPKTGRTVFLSDKLYDYRSSRSGSIMQVTRRSEQELLSLHIGLVERICEHWSESGDLGRYDTELFRWTLTFLGYTALKQEPDVQDEACRRIRGIWEKWFPSDICERAGLDRYRRQRYEWIARDHTRAEREQIATKIEKNDLAIAYLPEGLIGAIKTQVRGPLFKAKAAIEDMLSAK